MPFGSIFVDQVEKSDVQKKTRTPGGVRVGLSFFAGRFEMAFVGRVSGFRPSASQQNRAG